MNRHKIITALTAFAFGLFSFCAVANFAKYVPITVSGYSGPEIENYPALVKIDAASIPGVYLTVKNSGADLKFTDSSGEVEYPYEVDTWNPSGTSYVWVKIPSFAAGKTFRMYYGDSLKTTNPTAVNVWTGYDLVCHVNSNNANDSSANNFAGKLNPYGVSRSDGKIGNAYGMEVHDKGAAIVNKIYSGASGGPLANPRFTYSFWVRLTATMTQWHVFAGNKTSNNSQTWGIDVYAADGSQLRVWSKGGSQNFSTGGLPIGTWRKFDVVHDGITTRIYVDGASVFEKTFDSAPYRDWSDWVGWGGNVNNNPGYNDGSIAGVGESITGDFDECRVYASAMSADLIAANYAVESRNDIFSFGAPQSGYDIHKNRIMDITGNEQVAVFCEAGFYEWTPPVNAIDFRVLVVGGGGGGACGGQNSGGGGGGGEVIYRSSVGINLWTTYRLYVAPGAVGKVNPNVAIGGPAPSSFLDGPLFDRIEALGGGNGAGNWGAQNGGDGANGGGGGGTSNPSGVGGQPTAVGGHAGGAGFSSKKGGGGGGMSENGHDGNAAVNPGYGGAGVIYSITGEDVMYGHGGGGYNGKSGRYAFAGGPNGFGDGATDANSKGNPGEDGTGGGGGAGDPGTVGGSGTVIIRYALQNFPSSVTVNVAKQADAKEAGFVAGGFTFSCSDSARDVAFPIRYSVSGTAKSGRTYEELSGVAVIPAGQTSVDVPVNPLSDRITDYDSTVVVTIVPDSIYTVGSSSSATIMIINDPSSTSQDVRYVKTDGDDSLDGLSPATAYKSLRKAVHDFDVSGHGTVYVLPGEHKLRDYDFESLTGRSCVEVTTAVSIIGVGSTPADTVLSRDTSQYPNPSQAGYTRRIIYMNHPEARICNLTLSGGDCSNKSTSDDSTVNEAGKGGNIHIGALGGTVEDCVIKNGRDGHWASGGCNVYMDAGRVVRCVITGGKGANNRNPSTDTSYPYHGTAVCAYGGVVENCLIYGNGVNTTGGENNGATVGLFNRARLLSCTIANNFSDYCAGVAVLSKECVVQNCLIAGNTALSPAVAHANVWVSRDNDDTYSSCFVNCGSDGTIDDLNMHFDNPGFVDPQSFDFHLTSASPCRDSASGYASSGATSVTDLDLNPRKMGLKEDLGCYEYDPSLFACDFYADKTEALYRNDLGGTTFKFTAVVEGVYSGALTYHWDFDGDGTYDKSTSSAECSKTYTDPKLGGTGYYTVALKVVAASGEAFIRKQKYIHLAPEHVYVRHDSTGGEFPYIANTADRAAPTLYVALQAALDGTVIHMASGTYSYNPNDGKPQVERGVRVVGGSDNPADTVIEYPGTGNVNAMLLMVNHPDAWISGITFQGGRNYNDGNAAAGIRIGGNGGTVSNCVIRKCVSTGSAQHAGVWVRSGLLTHCIIEENVVTTIDEEHGYKDNGNSPREQAIFVDGDGSVQNCLIRNCKTDGWLVRLAHAEAMMRNCTIVDCTVSFSTDNPSPDPSHAVSHDYPRIQWPAYAIECDGGKGHVYNTVICNVKRKSFYDLYRGITWPEVESAPFCRKRDWCGVDGSGVFPEDNGCCEKCASDSPVKINDTCFLMTTGDFENYAGRNFVPKQGGALHDAGGTVAGWSAIVDLSGKGRVAGRRIDIGCYEQQKGDLGGVKIYVDCNYDGSMGVSDGSIECPWRTIREGCEVAESTNSYIYVRGGTDRVYTITDCRDAGVLVADHVYLLGCDAEWNPATGYTDPEAMVTLAISDTYAGSSYALVLSSAFNAPITVNGARCRVSGFRSEFGANSFRSAQGGDGLVNVFGSGSVIENCWFKGPDVANVKAGERGVIFGGKTQDGHNTQNVAIRNCYFWLPNGNSVYPFFDLNDGTRFENCLVENVASLYFTDNQVSHANYYIISNIFLNCASTTERQLLGNAQNNMPGGGEIAYNRAIHNNGVPGYYVFIQHGFQYGNNWYDPTYIHHNTIVGYDFAFMKNYRGGSASQESGRAQNERYCWTPNIFDNLLVDVKTNIWECAVGLFDGNNTSSFKSGSTFYNNAIYNGELLGGPATTFSWYDLKDLAGTNTTITVDANPPFVNTTDPHNDNYYRLRVPSAPWVIDAWVGPDPTSPEFPRYIGAIEPQPGGFAVRIR